MVFRKIYLRYIIALFVVLLGVAGVSAACTVTSVNITIPEVSQYYGGTIPVTWSKINGSEDTSSCIFDVEYDQNDDTWHLAGTTGAGITTFNWDTTTCSAGNCADSDDFRLRIAVGGNQKAINANFTIDNTAPTLTGGGATTYDDNHNGTVDRVRVTVVETGSGMDYVDTDGWTATDGCTVSAVSVFNATTVDVNLTGCTVGDTSITPTITYNPALPNSNSSDKAGNELASSNVVATDGAAPAPISAVYQDNNGDGTVDGIGVTFSEAVASYTFDANDWVIDTAGSIGLVSVDSNTSGVGTVINFSVTATSGITGGGTNPQLHYNDNNAANQITDGGANAQTGSTATISVTDSAGPAIISATTYNTTMFTVVFSEAIDRSTLADNDTLFNNTNSATFVNITSVNVTPAAINQTTYNITVGSAFAINENDSLVKFAGANSIADVNGNNNTQTASVVISDGILPTLTSAVTGDQDSNGQIDYYNLTFSENIDVSVLAVNNSNGFELAGYSGEQICFDPSGADCDPSGDSDTNTLYLVFTESGSADTNVTPDLTYNSSIGNVTDVNAQALANIASGGLTETDGAGPAIVSATTYNSTMFTIVFSEAIDRSTLADNDTLFNNTNSTTFVNITSASVSPLSINQTTYNITVANPFGATENNGLVKFAGANSIADVNGNNNTQTASVTISDGTIPTLISAVTGDQDSNGQIDYYNLTFSENIDVSALAVNNSNGFDLAGYSGEQICFDPSGADCDPSGDSDTNTLYLVFTESGNADTNITPDLTYDSSVGNVTDVNVQALANIASGGLTETDGAGPAIVSASSYNSTLFTIVFSEAIDRSSLIDNEIQYNNSVSGIFTSIASASISPATTNQTTYNVTVTNAFGLAENNGLVKFVGATLVKDILGNDNTQTSSVIINDGIVPTIVSATTGDQDADGQIDFYMLNFTENIDVSALAVNSSNGFDLTGYNGEKLCFNSSGTDCNPSGNSDTNILYLVFTESGSADTNITPDLIYNSAVGNVTDINLQDLANVASGDVTEADSAKPVVLSVTFSNNPADATSDTLITVTMSEDVSAGADPAVSVNQQGTTDVNAAAMVDSGDHKTFTYTYDVQAHTGGTYVDGLAYVGVSLASDGVNTMTAIPDTAASPYNFSINTVGSSAGSITITPTNPSSVSNLTVSGVVTVLANHVNDSKIVITRADDNTQCTINLDATDVADGAFDEVNETISKVVDLDVDCGGLTWTIGKTYRVSLLGQDVIGNWEDEDLTNTATFVLGTIQSPTIEDLDARITLVNSTIAAVDTRVTAVNSSLSTLDTKVNTINSTIWTQLNAQNVVSNVSDLTANVSTLFTNVGTLQTNVSNLASNVSAINTNIGTLQTDLAALAANVSANDTILLNKITSVNTSLNTLNGTVSALQTGLNAVNTSLGVTDSRVTAVNSSLQTLITRVNAYFAFNVTETTTNTQTSQNFAVTLSTTSNAVCTITDVINNSVTTTTASGTAHSLSVTNAAPGLHGYKAVCVDSTYGFSKETYVFVDVDVMLFYKMDLGRFNSQRPAFLLALYQLQGTSLANYNVATVLTATAGPSNERLTSGDVNMVWAYDGTTWTSYNVTSASGDFTGFGNVTGVGYYVLDLKTSGLGKAIRHDQI